MEEKDRAERMHNSFFILEKSIPVFYFREKYVMS